MNDERSEMQLSIGAVSRETGIPAATLRTWERRYGFPDPDRNESGHRIYDREVVDRLRLTERAIEAGYRPSNVVGRTIDELRDLLDVSDLDAVAAGETGAELSTELDETTDEWLADWLRASAELDGESLEREFEDAWNRMGGLDFVRRRAAPFLVAVGEAWARDDLKIVHEHYASECLGDFLRSRWRPRTGRSLGPTVVLATPEGEQHDLGLHLVAVLMALAGWQLVFLGPNTPVEELLEACRSEEPEAVGISVSKSYSPSRAASYLAELTEQLDDEIVVLAGGSGAPSPERNVTTFSALEELYEWAFARAN